LSRLIRLQNKGRHADFRQVVEKTGIFQGDPLKQMRSFMIGAQPARLLQLFLDTLISLRSRQAKIEIHVRQAAAGQGQEHRHPAPGGDGAEGGKVGGGQGTVIDDAVTVFQTDVRPVLFEQARQPLQDPVPLQIAEAVLQRMGGLRQGAEEIQPLPRPGAEGDALANAHDAAGSRKPLLKPCHESALAAAVNAQYADPKRHCQATPASKLGRKPRIRSRTGKLSAAAPRYG